MYRLLLLAVLTTAVGAAAALQSRFRGFETLPDNGDEPITTRRSTAGGGTRRGFAKSSCSATATVDAYAGRLKGYSTAVAALVGDVCDPAWDGSLQVLRDDMSEVAVAWARATVATAVTCTTEVSGGGAAKGCAYSKATAFAFEVAVAEAHAEASARVFDSCNCKNMEAWNFGESTSLKTLIADAYAAASAAACATGTQISEAEASVDCAARVLVEVYARAAANAAFKAECVDFGDASIASDVETETTTEVKWSEFCDEQDTVRGSAETETYSDVYADAYEP